MIMVLASVCAILAAISAMVVVLLALPALPMLTAMLMDHALVMLDTPTILVSALNALKVLFGAHPPANAFMSAAKTQLTLPQLMPVSAIPDMDYLADLAKLALLTISSQTDTALLALLTLLTTQQVAVAIVFLDSSPINGESAQEFVEPMKFTTLLLKVAVASAD